MAACASGQLPYSTDIYGGIAGNTAAESCAAAGTTNGARTGGGSYGGLSGARCELGYNGSGYTVAINQVCEVATAATPTPAASSASSSTSQTISCGSACTIELKTAAADPAHIADMSTLWGLFLGAAVVVLCLRKLLDLFNTTPHDS